MKRLTFLLFCLLLGIGMANAQTTKVTGTVISAEDNEPIIGASIVVKGTTIGTVTDFNGAFSLDVPSSAKTLVVSFGYEISGNRHQTDITCCVGSR